MFRNKYSNFLTVLLVILIIAIVIICIIAGAKIYKDYRHKQESKRAIEEFLADINPENNTLKTDSENDNNITGTNIIVTGENAIVEQNASGKKVKFYKGFVMLGYIEIPKTDTEYPILAEASVEALETSVGILYPTNPTLNTEGNVVIVGHNYRNGQFFSDNKKLSVGDKIKITDESGKKLTYTIYEIFETTPEDTEYMTRDTGGNIEISLSTCTDDEEKRLVILAKA